MKLNAKKCEVVGFGKFGNVSCTVDGSCMTVRDVGKCLGFWWEKCISENIDKARKAFFGYGSIGAFQHFPDCVVFTSLFSFSFYFFVLTCS